ncbi:hypothetical protein V2J09_021172 [Rumex salicifolius]
MEAVYSARPQPLSLIPRTSHSPSLCGIPSIRLEFPHAFSNSRLHHSRRRKRTANPPPAFRVLASLNSGQILVVVVAAVSAASFVYLNYFSRRKKHIQHQQGSPSLASEHSEELKELTVENAKEVEQSTGETIEEVFQKASDEHKETVPSDLGGQGLSVDGFHVETVKEVEHSTGEAIEEEEVFVKDVNDYHHQLYNLETASALGDTQTPNSLDFTGTLHSEQHADATWHFKGNGEVCLPLQIKVPESGASLTEVSEFESERYYEGTETVPSYEGEMRNFSSDSDSGNGECSKRELHLFYDKDQFITAVPPFLHGIPQICIEASYPCGLHISASESSDAVELLQENHHLLASGYNERNGSLLHYRSNNSRRRKVLGRDKGAKTCETIALLSYHNQHISTSRRKKVFEKESPLQKLNSYNRLLRYGRLKEGLALLEEMDKKGELDMNKVYHSKFLSICRSQKAVNDAFCFVKLIPNPTLSTFNMLMSVCSSAKDSEGAAKVWGLVQKAGFKADCKLYTTMVSTYGKSGKVDAMFKVFHDMVNDGVEPNLHTFGALIDGCGRSGQIAKAFGAYGILRSKKVIPDRVIFNALITACSQSGAVDRAFDVLQEMRAEPHPIDPDHFTIGSLMKACINVGQVDRVEEVYEMIQQYNIKGTPELYTIAVSSCSETGDWTFACKVYDDMRKNGVEPDGMFLSTLIDVAGHAGNIDAAFEVLQEAKLEGLKIGIIPYNSLMGACCSTKSWRKALELYEEIKALSLLPTVTTMNALITVLCEGNQLQKALEVFIEMKNMGLSPNDITYSILFVASEKNDDLDAGLMLLSQTKADGYPLNMIMSKCLIGMCSRKFQKSAALGELTVSFNSGKPQIDSKWTSLAVMIYREATAAGMIPSMEVLSQVLGCLQLPANLSLRERLVELLGADIEASRSANFFSLIDGFGEYDLRAFSLLEEAASLGIVPSVSFRGNPIVVDARKWHIHVGEVYLLTVLKGLKHRLAAGAKLPTVSIMLPVEEKKMLSQKGDKPTNIAGRVGQAIGAMLRRRGLPYHGNESYGKIRISGRCVKRWFQPKSVSAPFMGKHTTEFGLSAPKLGKQISDQQRDIRTENYTLR